MAQHKNNYDMALNVSNLECQKAQVGIATASERTAGLLASQFDPFYLLTGFFSGQTFNQLGQLATAGTSIAGATFTEEQAEANYNYLKTGMRQDYSRTSNMRVSATSTINTLYDSTFVLIYEHLPQYENLVVANYHALNGYPLERWVP